MKCPVLVGLDTAPACHGQTQPPGTGLPANGQNQTDDRLDLQSLLNMKVVTASKFSQDPADAPGGGSAAALVNRGDLLSRYFGPTKQNPALFIRGDNLLNTSIWLPDWGASTGDTLPIVRGRTVYFGLEVTLKD